MDRLLEKYKEFASYLDEVDLSNVGEEYSREEINGYIKELHSIKVRSVTSELRKVSKRMKEAEYPELLGIHHYPVLKEIDFLTEEQKLALDDFMRRFRVGNYLYKASLYRIALDKTEMLMEWLIDKGVLEKEYLLACINCQEDNLGKVTEDEKKLFEQNYEQYRATREYKYYEAMEEAVQSYCSDCDYMLEDMVDLNYALYFEPLFKVIKGRDTSLDNV